MDAARVVATALARKPAYDMSDVEVVRASCTSKDGTRVPLSILRRHGAKPTQCGWAR